MLRFFALTLPVACFLLLGCGAPSNTDAATQEQSATSQQLPADVVASLHPDTVQLQPLQQQVQLQGRVALNADQTAPVFSLVSGVVEEVRVHLGDQVAKDQVLAVIKSGTAAKLVGELAVAGTRLKMAQQQLEATKSLLADGLAAGQAVAEARAELRNAQAAVVSLQKQRAVYGLDADGRLAVRAPIAGTITEKNVAIRSQLNATNQERLFTISQLQDVWVLADVFQADVQKVHVGDTAQVTTLAYPNQQFVGQIDKIFNLLDPQARTMKVRVRLDNTKLLLKPGMYAKMVVSGQQQEQQLPTIPAGSTVFANGRRFVLVLDGQQRVDTREVQLHGTVGAVSYVAAGLQPGEQVATRNQLLIYKELND